MLIQLDSRIFNLEDVTQVTKKLQSLGQSQSIIEFHKGLTVIDSVVLADDETLEGAWDQIITAGSVALITV